MQGSLNFSRSDGSVVAANLARLDRFYASSFFWDGLGSMGIIVGTITSDHYPLKLNIVFNRRSYLMQFCIPNSLLVDGTHRVSIAQIWSKYSFSNASLLGDITHAITDIKSFFINIVASSVDRSNTQIGNLHRALATTQKLLEKFPTSSMLLSKLGISTIVIKLPGHKKQDKVNKEFFSKFKLKYKPLSIKTLKRLDGSYTTDDAEMWDIATTYYHQLLSAKSFSEENIN